MSAPTFHWSIYRLWPLLHLFLVHDDLAAAIDAGQYRTVLQVNAQPILEYLPGKSIVK